MRYVIRRTAPTPRSPSVRSWWQCKRTSPVYSSCESRCFVCSPSSKQVKGPEEIKPELDKLYYFIIWWKDPYHSWAKLSPRWCIDSGIAIQKSISLADLRNVLKPAHQASIFLRFIPKEQNWEQEILRLLDFTSSATQICYFSGLSFCVSWQRARFPLLLNDQSPVEAGCVRSTGLTDDLMRSWLSVIPCFGLLLVSIP